MTNIFENGKYTETTTYFDGWTLPEAERKLIIDFAEEDSGRNIFSEHIYDVGRRIDVTNAIEYGCDDDEIEENPELVKVKAILEKAFEAGVDIITFYK